MHPLSLKIIPPFQVLIAGTVIWLVHRHVSFGHLHFGWEYSISRALLFLCLVLFSLTIYQFWRHKTTINPKRIEQTSALITSGVFAWSRNPVYVIDALLLLAWVIWLGQWLNLVVPLLFIWYCTRFQIVAEEQVLEQKFPQAFEDYRRRVRRWL